MKSLRLLVSAAIASVVVLTLMVGVLWGFGLFDKAEEVYYAHPVEILSQTDRVDVAELVGGGGRRVPPPPPPAREIEPMAVPERQVTGFVQLEVEVDADGRVRHAAVVNALPGGFYEEQALRQVRARRYPPRDGGGTYIEVVPFRVAADEVLPRTEGE